MSRVEAADKIEGIVGVRRHATEHLGRAVSAEERVYVLHSEDCLARGIDLRKCEYSVALDYGIRMGLWAEYLDKPVGVLIDDDYDDLTPTDPPSPVSSTEEADRD